MIEPAIRISQVESYYFSTKLQEVKALASEGKPIINMGVGSPDLPPPPKVLASLGDCLHGDVHGYQSYRGIPELRKAMAEFYQQYFGVRLCSETQILPLTGSKEGVMFISMAYLNHGDAVLIPNPGYPTYSSVTRLLGAVPLYYELGPQNDWLPDLEALEKQDLRKVKIMWVNYPHMPSGAKASIEDLSRLVDFARKHSILLVNDNPYSLILNDEPLSLLSVSGASDVVLELNSISKTYNMSGWRVGMLLGSADKVDAVLKVKSQMDSGMFLGIQKGAVEALKTEGSWILKQNEIYTRRRELVRQLVESMGCTYEKGGSGLFVWAKLPPGLNSVQFCDQILYSTSVFICPGSVFGPAGEGYIRFSLCLTEARIIEVQQRMAAYISRHESKLMSI